MKWVRRLDPVQLAHGMEIGQGQNSISNPSVLSLNRIRAKSNPNSIEGFKYDILKSMILFLQLFKHILLNLHEKIDKKLSKQ